MSIKTLAGISAAAILSILAGNAYGELAEGLKATKSQGFDNTNAVSAILGGTALGYSGSAGAYVKVGNNDTNYATTLGGGGMYSGDQLVNPTSNWSILAVAKLKAGLENGAIYGIGRYNAQGSCHKGLALIQKDSGTVKLVHWAAVDGANNDTITTILDDVAVPYADLQYHSYLVTHSYTAAVADPETPARSTYTLYVDGVEKKTKTIDALEIDANGYQMGNVHGAIPEGLNYGTGILLDEVGVWSSDVGQTGATALATELPAYPTISVADVTITESATWAELIAATPNADTINITVDGAQTLTFGGATTIGNIIVKGGELIIADNSNLTADRITINSGATLTITEGSLTASKVDNSGTIKIDGGTAEAPVIIIEDGGTDSGIGQVVLTSGSVLKDDATGSGNKKYTITGADDHTSKLILNSNHNWGMPSDARLRNLTVEITGADFWIEHTAQVDSTVDIVTDKIIHFQNNNVTLGTLSGSGNHVRNGQNTVTLTMTSDSTYTGTSSIPFILAGTHGLTLSDGNTTPIDCEAKIGNTYYATLAAAKNVTVEGEKVVTLVKDLSNTTEDAAAGMTLVIPEGITLTTTKRLGGWSNNNGAKLVVKGTLTVNECHMPIENKSSIEIHGGATINGTPDREGAISIVTGANVSLVMEEGESIEIAAPICIRTNMTIDTPTGTEVSIAKLLKPYWENSGGVVTKTGAGALTIGEGGIENYVSISLSEGTINGDEGLASKITTSVSHNVVNFDNGVYSLGPDSHNIVVKSDIEHVKAEYTITHDGETSERKAVVDGAVSVVHGDKIDIYFVAEEGYEITSGETHIWYSGVKADVTSPHNPNPAIVVSPIAVTITIPAAPANMTVSVDGADLAQDGTITVAPGTKFSVTYTPAEGYCGTPVVLTDLTAAAGMTIEGAPTEDAKHGVASIDGVLYPSVQAAINAAQEGDVIELVDEEAEIPEGYYVLDDIVLKIPAKPIATVTNITGTEEAPSDLDSAYKFVANEPDEVVAAYYENWLADFEVSFDDAIDAGSIELRGFYEGAYGDNWVGFPLGEEGETIAKDEIISLMSYVSSDFDVTYDVISSMVKTFYCGVKNRSDANKDKTMTVRLVLSRVDEDTQKVVETITISKTEYTLVAPKATDLPGAEEVPENQKEAYNAWAAANGVTESTTTDTKVLATAYAMGVTIGEHSSIEEAAKQAVEDEVPAIDMAELVSGDLEAAVAAIQDKYPNATVSLKDVTTDVTGEGATNTHLYKLVIELK